MHFITECEDNIFKMDIIHTYIITVKNMINNSMVKSYHTKYYPSKHAGLAEHIKLKLSLNIHEKCVLEQLINGYNAY